MKLTKKIFAMLLCLTLVLSMATTAFAATVINETNHAYRAYQIFTGTQSEGSVNLGDVDWGDGVDGPALLAELQEVYGIYDNCTTAGGVAAILAADSASMDKDTDAKNFANIAAKHLTDKYIQIEAGATSVDLPTGYYLLVDIGVKGEDGVYSIPEGDAANPALLQVTNAADVKIAKKYTVPSVDKKIIENGERATAAEHSIGDVVTFELSATLPNNLADYDFYELVFHDTMSAGLTYNANSVAVYVDGILLNHTEMVADDLNTTENETVYNYDVSAVTNADDTTKLEVSFPNIKDSTVGAVSNGKITITYTATLNEKAVIDGNGNPNSVHLEFSNDPNWKATPDDGDKTNDVPPTGETPEHTVVIYTTEVTIVKKDGTTKNILTGAAFRIEGEGVNVVVITGDVYVPHDGTKDTTEYYLLKDGTYTTEAPTGSEEHDEVYASTTDKYMLVHEEAITTADGENAVYAEAFVNKDGRLTFSGLGVGTYTITEIVTPKGYNSILPITLTISFVNNHFQYTWSGGASGAVQEITVNNYQGSTLPETGGIGTTMFYAIGGIMVLAAVVLLVTKKRMASAE